MKNLLELRIEKLDELPKRELKKRHPQQRHYWGCKYPSNKVISFLHANIGQPWDKVYSKYHRLNWIPKDLRNLEHIKWHVVIDTFLKNGKVHYIPLYYGEAPIDNLGREKFYVHPQTKLLCVTKTQKIRANITEPKTMVVLGNYHQLLKLDGVWFEVKAEPVKSDNELVMINGLPYKEANVEPVERVVNGKILKDIAPADGVKYTILNGKLYLPDKNPRLSWNRPLGKRDRIIEHNGNPIWMRRDKVDRYSFKITIRRQLNSKELRKHGLTNDVIKIATYCKKCGGIVGRDCLYHYCNVCLKPNENCKCSKW